MRQRPDVLQPRALRAQWMCAVAEFFLKRADLSALDVLGSGYGSILDHPRVNRAARALHNLRQMGYAAAAGRDVHRAVADALRWEADNAERDDYREPPYAIDTTAPFGFRRRVPESDPVVQRMRELLDAPLDHRRDTTRTVDLSRPFHVVPGRDAPEDERVPVDARPVDGYAPGPPEHDLRRNPSGPIQVPLAELFDLARELDAADAAAGRAHPGNWEARLRDRTTGAPTFDLLVPSGTGLRAEDTIHLDGLKHLIGLPGSGKTTLIKLLLIWLARHRYRAVVLLPSIESSLNMLADLRAYDADCGLLVGQAPTTRKTHANRLAERLASGDEARGFGRTVPGSDLLGLTCPLDAFRADDRDFPAFPHMDPPCRRLRQRPLRRDGSESERQTDHLCALAGWCGRMRAPRELVDHAIWIGHILSTDTRIPAHFMPEGRRMRYFEAIARNADVVIVDEADGAQKTLDDKSVQTLDLTGSPESLDHRLNQDLFAPMASGRNDLTASNVQNYGFAATRFRAFNQHLVRILHRDARLHGRTEGHYARYLDRFVSGNAVLGELFLPDGMDWMTAEARGREHDRVDQIRALWDGVINEAMVDPTGARNAFEYDAQRVGDMLGVAPATVDDVAGRLASHVRHWVASDEVGEKQRQEDAARQVLFQIARPAGRFSADGAAAQFSLLLGVTTVVLQFHTLAAAEQSMVAEGVHQEPVTSDGTSEDLARLVPEAITGRLSGVRISFQDSPAGDGRLQLCLQYLVFKGAPRMLLYRWHELLRHEGLVRGPNVVLASATSHLAPSPSYHIPVGPDMVLRQRGRADRWSDSVWRINAIPDPRDPARPLRFSGAPLHRRRQILEAMIAHYYSGDTPRVEALTRDFDSGRKVAFVVNSFEQVHWVKDYLRRHYERLNRRTLAVAREAPDGAGADWLVASQVETIGARSDWDAIVFPMKAISRGVNIVFPDGPRQRQAVIGTVVFLVRPHPATDSLPLVTGLVGRASQDLDAARQNPDDGINDLRRHWHAARNQSLNQVRRLFRHSIVASRLGSLMWPFVADVMVDVLQTIGRAMRGGVPARVIFADAAWAPGSAAGGHDTPHSSMLLAMRDMLETCVASDDAVDAEVYQELYTPFLDPLRRCENLRESTPDREENAAE